MVMKAIKVNADYESVLFQNKPLPAVNEALEFLAFFLDSRPLQTKKRYSPEYFDYIEEITGARPKTVAEGSIENWWGAFKDLELEKKLNSKEMSAQLTIDQQWCNDTRLIESLADLPDLSSKQTYLAKNPYGMSGQNFCKVEEGRLENLERLLKNGKVVLEPFFDRVFDFSHYVFPNGLKICYENIVDQKFQYRGTVFKDFTVPTAENLSFYSKISKTEWDKFKFELETIVSHYQSKLSSGFSVDSFVYKENEELKIRSLSEVNHRRTMGQTAFELSIKFGGLRKWNAFILSKSSGMNFLEMRDKIKSIEWHINKSRGVIILSPGDVRYNMFFLSALTAEEGKTLIEEFKTQLPDAEIILEHFDQYRI
jgi:hypothetical protein